MHRPAAAALLVLLSSALAGCAGSDPATGESDLVVGPDGQPVAPLALHNYTTLHPGGEPFTRSYSGRLTADEAAQSNGMPLGVEAPSFPTCCSVDMVEAADLLATDQLVALRLTLRWTNTQNDHAGFDVATCLPWSCLNFNDGPDESMEQGEHTDVLDLITSGRADFADQGIPYQVGVRFTNAVLASGLDYTIDVEAFPVGNGLAVFDPYTLDVAENATVSAELVGPYAADGVSLALMLYDAADRPVQWIPLSGDHLSRHELDLAAGSYVVIPMAVQGGFVRLASDAMPPSHRLERLAEEFSTVPVATVADAAEHSGTFSYDAPAGTIDPFPVFVYADGAAVQDPFGVPLPDEPLGGAHATLRSSSGDIAVVDQYQDYVQASAVGQQLCLQCNFFVPSYSPENYIDDDGTYEVEWSSQGASGSFMLFTARYLR